jgi:hypothetical protein
VGTKVLLGIYVSHSPSHSGLVALVLNPRTGHVLPQFHVLFDDLFTTVPYMNKNKIPPNWADLVKKSSGHLINKIHDVPVAKTWLLPNIEHGIFAMQEATNNN